MHVVRASSAGYSIRRALATTAHTQNVAEREGIRTLGWREPPRPASRPLLCLQRPLQNFVDRNTRTGNVSSTCRQLHRSSMRSNYSTETVPLLFATCMPKPLLALAIGISSGEMRVQDTSSGSYDAVGRTSHKPLGNARCNLPSPAGWSERWVAKIKKCGAVGPPAVLESK